MHRSHASHPRWLARVVGAAALTATATAHAQSADSRAGIGAYARAEFDAANGAFVRVLADRGASRHEIAEAHRYLAVVRTAGGDPVSGRSHAASAVALEPDATPPEGAPPEVVGWFDAARARVRAAGGPVRVAIASAGTPRAGDVGRVRAEALGLTAELPLRVTLRCAARGAPVGEESASTPTLTVALETRALRSGDELECHATLTTSAGAVLDRAALRSVVPSGGGDRGVIYGLAIAGGVVAVAGLVAGIWLATQPTQATVGAVTLTSGP